MHLVNALVNVCNVEVLTVARQLAHIREKERDVVAGDGLVPTYNFFFSSFSSSFLFFF